MDLRKQRADLVSPCKGCTARKPGCHDHCQAFRTWKDGQQKFDPIAQSLNDQSVAFHVRYQKIMHRKRRY